LANMESETGAAGMSRDESEAELNGLTEQVADDVKYIGELEAAMAQKSEEWKTRSTLRANEVAAISKAIQILSNDDAKDLFKKSLASQGAASFVQVSSTSIEKRRHAVAILTAASAGDHRVVALAARMASKGHFDEVIVSIDKMVTLLKDEEATELQQKEDCEANRMSDTREAVDTSRKMDDMTDTIVRLQKEIADHAADIADKEDQVKANEKALAAATQQRSDEAAEFEAAKAEDEAAAETVQNAATVLQKFYADNDLMLVQKKTRQPSW